MLFTRNHDPISELICWITRRQYTHASLGLGSQTETFYSFTARGFKCEHPGHRKAWHGQKDSLCYRFTVTDAEYALLQQNIDELAHGGAAYNTLGTVLCVLHIYKPFKNRKAYFCSEFVAEQLRALTDDERAVLSICSVQAIIAKLIFSTFHKSFWIPVNSNRIETSK